MQNEIKRDSWSILQKSRIQLYLQNATRYAMSPTSAKLGNSQCGHDTGGIRVLMGEV